MIYIASPYSSQSGLTEQIRFEQARQFVAHLFNQGIYAFSPIVYAHEMAQAEGMKTDAAHWLDFNSTILRRAEAMYLLQLFGWQDSVGVTHELTQCDIMRIPVIKFDAGFNQVG